MITPLIEEAASNRAERRRAERAGRKAASSLLISVSRAELSEALRPIVTSGQQHELILSFLLDKGLLIRDGRAVLDADELDDYLAEKDAEAAKGALSLRNGD